jgi:hypothetical protein
MYDNPVASRLTLDGVDTGNGLVILLGANSNSLAVAVASGVLDASIDPEGVRTVVRASDEALTSESEVTVGSDLPALCLGVLRDSKALVGDGGVAELALTHTGAVDVSNLRILEGVEVKLAILVDAECDLVLGEALVAGGALVLELESEVALRGLESGVVDVLVAADSDTVVRGGRNHASGDNGGEEGSEVHLDGLLKRDGK